MAETPSLTPHRDQVLSLLTTIEEGAAKTGHWQDRVATRLIREIHLAMADERDAGRTVAELTNTLPFLLHNCASALLGSVGIPDEVIPALMMVASQKEKLTDKSVMVSAPMPRAAGGQA